MNDNEKFITEFVAAAKDSNEEKMKELAETVTDRGLNERVELLEDLVSALKEEEANEEVTAGLAATLELMKLAAETQDNEDLEDSASAEAKDDKQATEATKDVAADTGAAEAETPDNKSASQGEAEGEAPAKEEKEEKSDDK